VSDVEGMSLDGQTVLPEALGALFDDTRVRVQAVALAATIHEDQTSAAFAHGFRDSETDPARSTGAESEFSFQERHGAPHIAPGDAGQKAAFARPPGAA